MDGPSTGTRNLKLLRQTLSENPLDALQRRVILGMIDDGMFGEAYATDVEARPVRRGKKIVFVESKVRFSRGTAEHRADIAFKRGQPDLAMKILEDSPARALMPINCCSCCIISNFDLVSNKQICNALIALLAKVSASANAPVCYGA